jgi:hypothetical protein
VGLAEWAPGRPGKRQHAFSISAFAVYRLAASMAISAA